MDIIDKINARMDYALKSTNPWEFYKAINEAYELSKELPPNLMKDVFQGYISPILKETKKAIKTSPKELENILKKAFSLSSKL